jgi:hypothetical protein
VGDISIKSIDFIVKYNKSGGKSHEKLPNKPSFLLILTIITLKTSNIIP